MQNLDIPKLMYFDKYKSKTEINNRFPEKYLPKEMQLGTILRIFRFLFFLLTLLCGALIANYGNDKDAFNYCHKRESCLMNCMDDNYPNLTCENTIKDVRLNYKENDYYDFYLYQEADTPEFQECYSISQNVLFFLWHNALAGQISYVRNKS